jgi:hypothetical protein
MEAMCKEAGYLEEEAEKEEDLKPVGESAEEETEEDRIMREHPCLEETENLASEEHARAVEEEVTKNVHFRLIYFKFVLIIEQNTKIFSNNTLRNFYFF